MKFKKSEVYIRKTEAEIAEKIEESELNIFKDLVRRKRGDFPIFADHQMLRNNHFEKAYLPLRRKNQL